MNIEIYAQVYTAVTIFIVWVLRYEVVQSDFRDFGYPDKLRNFVGAAKISISTLLICGIWHKSLVPISALSMALLMLCAQLSHFKIGNPLIKFVPSAILLILNLYIAYKGYLDLGHKLF